MTSDDITRLTPLVEDLQRRNVLTTYSTTSWPDHAQIARDGYHGEGSRSYTHAFRLRSAHVSTDILLVQPFTEDDVINRIAAAQAREGHSAAIEATYALSKDALLRDLANLYRLRLLGKPVPVPSSVTIKDLVVPLTS